MSSLVKSLKAHRWLYHVLFWLAYLLIFSLMNSGEIGVTEAVWTVALTGVAFAVPIYFNILYLIPRYLMKGAYLKYILWLIVIPLLCAYPMALVWDALYGQYFEPEMQFRGLMLICLFNTGFMIMMTTGLKLVKKFILDQQNQNDLKNEQLRTELDFLRSQVNPHFLFNTLNNLYSLTLTKSDKAPEIVLKLSAILRYMLYDCNEPKVFLNNEITYLQNYIELESLRQGGNARIELHVEGNTDRKRIAPLLFTPLLENSIKHGLNYADGGGYVKMDLRVSDDNLDFSIENSKSPVPANTLSKSSGIGLVNLRRRLELIYPDRNTFKIADKSDSYKVLLNLNLTE